VISSSLEARKFVLAIVPYDGRMRYIEENDKVLLAKQEEGKM